MAESRWVTDAGLVIETAGGSMTALLVATGLFAALGAWRAATLGISPLRFAIVSLAAMAGAWLGGAVLGPPLFDDPSYTSLVGAPVAAAAGGCTAWLTARGGEHGAASVADAFAPPALVALAAARIGCLFQGCEVGSRTDLPWGVRHIVGTRALAWQRRHADVDPFARLSEPVHPLALYEALPLFVAAALLWRLRPGDGRVAWIAVAVWAGARTLLEAFRAENIGLGGVPLWVISGSVAAFALGALLSRYEWGTVGDRA